MNSMKIMDLRFTVKFFFVFLMLGWSLAVVAQGEAERYPDRPLRLIVPYAAGGGTDVVARLVAKRVEKELGQPVVVDNRPGGNTLIAVSALMSAPADGYTFMAVAADTLTILPHLQEVPYDVKKDFKYTGLIATYPAVLIARKDFPVSTPEETIAMIKSKGSELNYATYGTGSVSHIGMSKLLQEIGGDMLPVPYKGGAPAAQDLLGGRVDLIMGELTTFAPYIQNNSVKAIALTGKSRLPSIPEVPTLDESSVSDFEWSTWLGTLVRKDSPAYAVDKLSRAFEAAMTDPEVRAQLENRHILPTYMNPDDFEKLILETDKEMDRIIKTGNITTN
jgi:tripartite-type tricarboxylate transporter receptor subunit TctC